MTRRRSFVHKRLREELSSFLRLARWPLLQILALDVLVTAVSLLAPGPRLEAGITIGVCNVGCLALTGFLFLLSGDGALLVAGSLGESSTREALDSAHKAGDVWFVVPNVEASNRDVDHIVLTPAGVLALETKWRFRNADARWLQEAATAAAAGARLARLVLQAKPIDQRRHVSPVLVVWGGARRELPAVHNIGDVTVARGDHLARWLTTLGAGQLTPADAAQLHSGLRGFVESRR